MSKEERKYYVYCHTNKVNGKKYVGITCQKPENRWANGLGYVGNYHFNNAIKKYGWDNFKHEILFDGLNQKDAEDKEIELIAEWNLTNKEFGYNIAKGGFAVCHSKETRERISKNRKGKGLGIQPPNYKSYTGKKFGRLTIISEYTENWQHYCVCRCDCGNEVTVIAGDLKNFHTKSCGCYMKERNSQVHRIHGMRGTRIYRIWRYTKGRCCNKNHANYLEKIEICDEWKNNFISFYNWAILNGYNDNLSLLRKNNNRDYEPSNCYWGLKSKRILCVETNIEYSSVQEASDLLGISVGSINRNLSGYRKSAGSYKYKPKGFHFIFVEDKLPKDEKK